MKLLLFVIKRHFVLKNIQWHLQILIDHVRWNRWRASIHPRRNISFYMSSEQDRCISVIISKIFPMEVAVHWRRLKTKRMIFVDLIWSHVSSLDWSIRSLDWYFQVINISQQLDCHSRMKVSSSEKEIIVPFGFNM